jgi:hypothetical protein
MTGPISMCLLYGTSCSVYNYNSHRIHLLASETYWMGAGRVGAVGGGGVPLVILVETRISYK